MKSKVISKIILLFCLLSLTFSCGPKNGSAEGDGTHYSGVFVDEFENQFTLNEDHTGTIHFFGNSNVSEIEWAEHEKGGRKYATISFNGDPSYYFLYKGYLFRQEKDMEELRCPIIIKYNSH